MSLVLGSTIATADASSLGSMMRLHKNEAPSGIRQAEMAAIESADYAAWKAAVESSGHTEILDKVNEDNFAKFAEAVKLRGSGDGDGVQDILEEMGIKNFGRKGKGGEIASQTDQSVLADAFRSKDYETWKSLMEERGGGKILEVVNADNFAKFAEAKVLQSEGKYEEAKAILDELGFPFKERNAGRFRQTAGSLNR